MIFWATEIFTEIFYKIRTQKNTSNMRAFFLYWSQFCFSFSHLVQFSKLFLKTTQHSQMVRIPRKYERKTFHNHWESSKSLEKNHCGWRSKNRWKSIISTNQISHEHEISIHQLITIQRQILTQELHWIWIILFCCSFLFNMS